MCMRLEGVEPREDAQADVVEAEKTDTFIRVGLGGRRCVDPERVY